MKKRENLRQPGLSPDLAHELVGPSSGRMPGERERQVACDLPSCLTLEKPNRF